MPPEIVARYDGNTTAVEAAASSTPLPALSTSQPSVKSIHGRVSELLVLAFIVTVTLIYFWRFIDPWSQQPAFFPLGDLTDQFYPYRHYAVVELSEGRFPIWAPSANAGQPFVGDIQTAVFYPPNLLLAYALMVLGRPDLSFPVFQLFIILHYVVAAVGLHVFVRRLTASRIGGLVSAMAFSFGGLMTSYPPQQTAVIQSMVWLPYAMLFLREALVRKQARYFLPAAASLCLSVLGGHPQTTALAFYGAAAYALWTLFLGRRTSRDRRGFGNRGGLAGSGPALPDDGHPNRTCRPYGAGAPSRSALRAPWGLVPLALTFVLALALTVQQLAPTAELWRHSSRAITSYDFTQAGFPAFQAIGLLFPAPVNGYPMYVGFLAIVLALLAMARVRHRDVLFWALTAVISYLLSFGGLTPLYSVARTVIPGYAWFRGQERAIYLTAFALAVLAGYGAAWLLSSGPHARRVRVLLGLIPLVVLGAGLAVADPGTHAALLAPTASVVNVPPPAYVLPLIVLGATLVLYLASGLRRRGATFGGRAPLLPALLVALVPLAAAADNLSINWNNLAPRANERFPEAPISVAEVLRQQAADGRIGVDDAMPFAGYYYRLPFLRSDAQLMSRDFLTAIEELGFFASEQLFGQRYVVTREESPSDELLFQWRELYVYRLRTMPGRVSVIYRRQSIPDPHGQLEAIKAGLARGDFRFGRDAVVDGPVSSFAGGGYTFTQTVSDLKPTEVLARVDTTAPATLVLADIYYPGWHAYVDGREVPLQRADFAVRGVAVPAGAHLVSFRYDPVWYRLGLGIGSIGLIVLLFSTARAAARRRPGLTARLPAGPHRALHLGRWLIPIAAMGGATIFAVGFGAPPAPAIPSAWHDAEQWDAASVWAAGRCGAIIALTSPGSSPPPDRAFYASWDDLSQEPAATRDSVCVLADLSAAPRPEQMEPPPGWQKTQVWWSGTVWAGQYHRQAGLLAQVPFKHGGALGGAFEILGFAWPGAIFSDDSLRVNADVWSSDLQLFLRSRETTPTDYRVFVQLLDANGQAVSVSDHQPRDGARPTSSWVADEIIADPHRMARPPLPGPDEYLLVAGLYDEKTKTRLRTADGQDHVVLARVQMPPS